MVLLIPLLELLVLLVGIGMATLSRPQAGGFVNWLAKVGENIPIFGGLLSAEQIVKLDRWFTHEIGRATGTITRRGVKWFGALTHYQDVVGYWSLYWPVGLFHAVQHLVGHVIPRSIDARTRPLQRQIDATEAQAKAAAGYAHSLPKTSKAQDHAQAKTQPTTMPMPWAGQWDWIHHHFKELQHAVTSAVADAPALPGVHAPSLPINWPFHLRGIRKRLTKLEKLAVPAGIAPLLSQLFGVSKSCLKGDGNIGKTARRLCGLDKSLLDSLLLDGLAIVGAVSVVEFAEGMRAIEDEAIKVMGALIEEWPS